MTHTVCVKLAPVLTVERWDDPKWMRPDRVFYWPGSLKLIPRQPTPIVRDHDMDDVIGTVTELLTMPFTDGEWIVARGVIDDPPSWLRQYRTKASVGYWNVHSTPHINGSTRITSALVQEVSLLRDLTPAEPLAEVALLQRSTAPSSRPTIRASVLPAGDQVICRHPTPSSGDRADTSSGCADGHVEAGPPSPARLVYGCAERAAPPRSNLQRRAPDYESRRFLLTRNTTKSAMKTATVAKKMVISHLLSPMIVGQDSCASGFKHRSASVENRCSADWSLMHRNPCTTSASRRPAGDPLALVGQPVLRPGNSSTTIPCSVVRGRAWRFRFPMTFRDGQSRDTIAAFKGELDRARVPATVRLTRGRDIAAACGQLATEPRRREPARR